MLNRIFSDDYCSGKDDEVSFRKYFSHVYFPLSLLGVDTDCNDFLIWSLIYFSYGLSTKVLKNRQLLVIILNIRYNKLNLVLT